MMNSESPSSEEQVLRAAQYVRVSTEHQQYSIDNQSDEIKRYAAQHNMEIIRTYSDAGKSGLTIEHRPGLRQLLQDVEGGCPGYCVILVYDVSRWGRFQDADESGYYEYLACVYVLEREDSGTGNPGHHTPARLQLD
jgi:DNA invertase Pin-like site-specific DNA recombinase